LKAKKRELRNRIDRVREIEDNQAMFELATKEKNRKKFKRHQTKVDDEDEFLIDDYESDSESSKRADPTSNLSKEVQDLLSK
jgi:chromosome transmission fidelity protein 1